ncbi:MAG: hypothetical protein ABIT01_06165 [Thermoanaerobaculia bacterium]
MKTSPTRQPLARLATILALLSSAVLWSGSAAAQNDLYYNRVRGLTDVPFPSFQGAECTTIKAPRALVWRVLVSPGPAGTWLLADLDNVVPRGARYKKGFVASKDDVLTITSEVLNGPRTTELRVLATIPERVLTLAVTKDDDVIAHDIANLIYTFVLESNPDGSTDLYWATHYDPSSPFAAAFSGIGSKKSRLHSEKGLLVFKGLAEAATLTKYPPLPDLPVESASSTR